MGFPIFIKDVIKQFRAHILRGCQFVLLKVLEDEARAIIDKFKLKWLLLWYFQQNVFSLDVGVDYLMMRE